MTPGQRRLAIADLSLSLTWVLLNFFWMWSMYRTAIAFAALAVIACAATLLCAERTVATLCVYGANVSWAVVDIFWMLENGGLMKTGLYWASAFTALFLVLAGIALTHAVAEDSVALVAERLKRVRRLFTEK
jgi:hypothetical protein